MAIRGRSYINYPLVRRLNLTLFKAGTAQITATGAITSTGQPGYSGTAMITATGAITATGTHAGSGTATITATGTVSGSGSGGQDFDIRIGHPYAITFGPPF